MKNIILPLTAVNYRSVIELYLTTDELAALCSSWQSINCDIACFGRKIKINWDLFGMLWNFTDPLYVYFVELSTKKISSKFDF